MFYVIVISFNHEGNTKKLFLFCFHFFFAVIDVEILIINIYTNKDHTRLVNVHK